MLVLSDLTKYGAILAKVSVMRRSLLSAGDYLELIGKRSVAEAAAFLKNETAYADVLSSVSEGNVHRGELELLMRRSYADDAVKLYRFDNNENKRFYTYVYIKEEIELIKNILRRLNNAETIDWTLHLPEPFLRHLTVRPERLTASRDIREFLENLSGSRFESVIAPLLSLSEHQNLFSVEMTLDMYYYRRVDELRAALTDKEDKEVVTMTIGSEIDVLNLLYIYRCKRYFHMPTELIYSLLIPNKYMLSKGDIKSLVEASSAAEFFTLVQNTPYHSIFPDDDDSFYSQRYAAFQYRLHKKAAKLYPYSIEAAVSYLHFKETEIQNITSVIECIRYGLSPKEILPYVAGFELAAAAADG